MLKRLVLLFCLMLSLNCLALDDITYNSDTLKFYSSNVELTSVELQKLYPDYKIILISKFNKDRKYYLKNSIFKSQKVLLVNDTKRTFQNFYIYPESSRGENKSLITVYGKKNVRLKHFGGDEFEIVVR